MPATTAQSGADDTATISLQGRITAYTAGPIWRQALDVLARNANRPVNVDASGLEYIDDTDIALIFAFEIGLKHRQPPAGGFSVFCRH